MNSHAPLVPKIGITLPFIVTLTTQYIYLFNSSAPIDSYHTLVEHLTNGARVTYFFNTSSCQPISNQKATNLPVFGGEINLFLTTNANSQTESLVFNNDKYVAGRDTKGM